MAEFPALPLFTDAYLRDCWHLSDAEHGRYFLLMILIWQSPECRIPNDREWIARKLRRSPEKYDEEVKPLVDEFCQNDGNWITQKRLTKERDYLRKNAKSQSGRAKSRWNKEKDICPSDAAPHRSGNAPTPTPTPTPIEVSKAPLSPPKGGAVENRKDLENGRKVRGNRYSIRTSVEQAIAFIEARDAQSSGEGSSGASLPDDLKLLS